MTLGDLIGQLKVLEHQYGDDVPVHMCIKTKDGKQFDYPVGEACAAATRIMILSEGFT